MTSSRPSLKRYESNEDALKFLLEEYRVLANDIQSRVALQHGLFNFLILVAVAVAGLLGALLKDDAEAIYREDMKLCLLFLPTVFAFFVKRHLNHDVNIIDKAAYIHQVLRPKVARALGNRRVLEFEAFLRERRATRTQQFSLFVWLGNEQYLHLLLCFVSLVCAYSVFFLGPGEWRLARSVQEVLMFSAQSILLILGTTATVGAVIAWGKVRRGYQQIVGE